MKIKNEMEKAKFMKNKICAEQDCWFIINFENELVDVKHEIKLY